MTISELGEKCKERGINCENFPHKNACNEIKDILDEIYPCGLLDVLNEKIGE